MDKKLFELGLSKRKATLGKEYVEKNLDSADEFNEDFQKQMTEWCWGFGWGDDTIDAKTRSMMNLPNKNQVISRINYLPSVAIKPCNCFLNNWTSSILSPPFHILESILIRSCKGS